MPHASKLHRLAKRIADKLSQGKPPALTAEMAAYLEDRPEAVFDSLDGFVRQHGESDEGNPLAAAYLMLMAIQLEHLRYQIDRDYAWAKEMQREFERRVVSLAQAGDLRGRALGMLTGAMREARLRPGPDLLALSEDLFTADISTLSASEDLNASLEKLANDLGDDVFALVDAVDKATVAMPPEVRAALAGQMAVSPFPNLKEAAPLFLLDPEAKVRHGAAGPLLRNAAALSPTALRRLIAIRNWVPEDERPLIDQVVREARAKGVVCASWRAGNATEICASAIDGAGTQGFMIVSPAGRRQRLSSILMRHGSGILDAWSADPSSKREIAEMFDQARATTPLLSVSRGYLDRTIAHHLDVGLASGTLPPVGLLQVAEEIRAPEWRPDRIDWRATLDALIDELPPGLLDPPRVEEIIGTSADWAAAAADGLSDSWFEDDQEVDDLLRNARTRRFDTLVERIFSNVLEHRRLKWAERFLWVALWLREAPDGDSKPWPHFAILGRELIRGRRLRTVPLMEDIAIRTVMAMHG